MIKFIHTDQIELLNYDLRAEYRHEHPQASEVAVDFGAFFNVFRRWAKFCSIPAYIM